MKQAFGWSRVVARRRGRSTQSVELKTSEWAFRSLPGIMVGREKDILTWRSMGFNENLEKKTKAIFSRSYLRDLGDIDWERRNTLKVDFSDSVDLCTLESRSEGLLLSKKEVTPNS